MRMAASSTSDQIRLATPADAPACADIYREAVLNGTGTFETEPPDVDEMRARMGRILGVGRPWLVAERDGRLIGYAYMGQFREREAYRHFGETSVYVAPDAKGQGIGKRLLERLLVDAKAAGFTQAVAVIGDSGNQGSIALHTAVGFHHVGVLAGAGLKFGRWLDVVLMQRAL